MNLKAEKFSMYRIYLLLRRDLGRQFRTLLLVVGAAAAILITIDVLSFSISPQQGEAGHYEGLFASILIIGGFIFSSTAFSELNWGTSARTYLLLPASPLEKTVERILLSGIGWALLSLVWFSLYSYLSVTLTELLSGRHHPLFRPMGAQVWQAFAHYLVLHSFFLFGSIFFRKNPLFKTLLSLFAVALLYVLLSFVAVRIIFAPYVSGTFAFQDWKKLGLIIENLQFRFYERIDLLRTVRDIFYWGALAPIMWILSYLRLREVEIKDAV
ncbi:MAG TPA: hypothetical protein ENN41_08355 [Sediminispirochaeta sp.]|nr:hypothetical protein [Sediminispirochaeta sp.]